MHLRAMGHATSAYTTPDGKKIWHDISQGGLNSIRHEAPLRITGRLRAEQSTMSGSKTAASKLDQLTVYHIHRAPAGAKQCCLAQMRKTHGAQ
eukprot:CAMPEP_0176185818 /NCGR_PEP_ID=MMETSP0121_2-20121125/1551_1 /TAXON_ID=160619 /ORGANISM="Kryptoperidinium foliaceum, Strain CCMP 1326" /LENGTH=92 /DNA_ID=CAMNT_0017524285 /DNA_START=103 /DNA_END=378 /DNA_ORIENTATION=+